MSSAGQTATECGSSRGWIHVRSVVISVVNFAGGESCDRGVEECLRVGEMGDFKQCVFVGWGCPGGLWIFECVFVFWSKTYVLLCVAS